MKLSSVEFVYQLGIYSMTEETQGTLECERNEQRYGHGSARQMFSRATKFSVSWLQRLACAAYLWATMETRDTRTVQFFKRQGGLSVITALSAGNTITIRSAVTAKHMWSVQVSAACIVRLHGVITRKIYK